MPKLFPRRTFETRFGERLYHQQLGLLENDIGKHSAFYSYPPSPKPLHHEVNSLNSQLWVPLLPAASLDILFSKGPSQTKLKFTCVPRVSPQLTEECFKDLGGPTPPKSVMSTEALKTSPEDQALEGRKPQIGKAKSQ